MCSVWEIFVKAWFFEHKGYIGTFNPASLFQNKQCLHHEILVSICIDTFKC